MSPDRPVSPQANVHRRALRYFLRRETSLGMYVGEFDLDDVRAAMRFFAHGQDLKEPRPPQRPSRFSLQRLFGAEAPDA